ncbi:MAG: hypothetical protein GQE15_15305 [Archangiaceae bacterium]|nr:hypothetical protein [Archangiaceae bacterium]
MTVPDEVQAVLDGWSARGRKIFQELMEDASSELQQELVQRAILAGHTTGEVHAFADELRGLSDDECFAACTLDDDAPEDYTVTQLLRAESDPLFAFELKGGTLTPNEEDDAPSAALPAQRREVMDAPIARELAADPVRRAKEQRAGFNAESGGFRSMVASKPAALAATPVAPSGAMPAMPAAAGRLFEDLLGEATRALGVSWREVELDVPGGVPIDQALQQAAGALQRGIPIPCVIGNAQGRPLRYLLVLQTSTSGTNRAFQLYEPFSQELVWANEKDLLSRGELPFDNKSLRRLLRMALPNARGL